MDHSLSRLRLPICLFLILVCIPVATAGERQPSPLRARWHSAFQNAVRDPATWAPAAGAVVFAATDLDRSVSDWAIRETPVFGSVERAARASDDLRNGVRGLFIGISAASLLGQRSWDGSTRLMFSRAAPIMMTYELTGILKSATDRARPNDSDLKAFPSGHSSAVFTLSALGIDQLDAMDWPRPARRGLGIGLRVMASGTAWARVEAGMHYPSDILFGAALGNFVGRFLGEAILPDSENYRLRLNLDPQSSQVSFVWRF